MENITNLGTGEMTDTDVDEIEELYDVIELGDKIIRIQTKALQSLGYYDIELNKWLAEWHSFIATIEEADVCPSVSPQTKKPCALRDTEKDHINGHRSNSKLPLAWSNTQEDYKRWSETSSFNL